MIKSFWFVTYAILAIFETFSHVLMHIFGQKYCKNDQLEYINCNKCDLPQLKFKRRRSSILDFFIYDFNPFGKG